ncbi:nucleotidyltransferase family protein [Streptomyces sp. NPDC007851]|uniref:nucleotidyltransferase family protein n=1 Tax=Streptomyces sp. NPDC007851 TaxID=3155008 RepID=UPI0034016720
MLGRLPLDEQLAGLRSVLSENEILTDVLARTATLALPNWYVTAGCLFQTVWNVVTGRHPADGIKDYDVFYFDGGDLSWDAEDAVIKAGRAAFAGLPAEVEIRNEARVHLWYEQKFGVRCPPHGSTEAAIDCFAATTCCLGVRLEPGGRWRVYAPHGLSDVFNLVVRPNPVLAPREVYETKAARWKNEWPQLTVLPWPDPDPARTTAPPY